MLKTFCSGELFTHQDSRPLPRSSTSSSRHPSVRRSLTTRPPRPSAMHTCSAQGTKAIAWSSHKTARSCVNKKGTTAETSTNLLQQKQQQQSCRMETANGNAAHCQFFLLRPTPQTIKMSRSISTTSLSTQLCRTRRTATSKTLMPKFSKSCISSGDAGSTQMPIPRSYLQTKRTPTGSATTNETG